MNNNNHPMLSDGANKCPGKAIYSELNYEKLRTNRLNEIDAYYKKVLKQYENNKKTYNAQYKDLSKQANNADAELQNKTTNNATKNDIQEVDAVIKPTVVRLNKQLLTIASKLIDDNENTGKGLLQQYQDLQVQEKELNKLMNNVSILEDNLKNEETVQLTRYSRIDSSQDVTENTYYWYNGMLMINFMLSLFLVIYSILIYKYSSLN